jgi:hypothetical protein
MEPRELRYVTQHYAQLQGLRLLPVGVLFLMSATWRAFGPHSTDGVTMARLWFFGGLVTAVVVSFMIRAWYQKRFGFVSQPIYRGAPPLIALFIGCVIAAWLADRWDWVVSWPWILVGTALLAIGVTHRARRKHYLAVTAVWFAALSAGAFGASVPVRGALVDLAIGLGLIIAGFGDHQLLQRTLQPPNEGGDDVCSIA